MANTKTSIDFNNITGLKKPLTDATTKDYAARLFNEIKRLSDSESIDTEEAKEMVASIVKLLKEHQVTYHQANVILKVTEEVLNIMSQSLSLNL